MPNSLNKIVKQVGVIASAIGAGVVTGLMLAPKSGKESRKDIKDKLDETKETLEEKTQQVKDELKEKSSEVKKDIKSKVADLKK